MGHDLNIARALNSAFASRSEGQPGLQYAVPLLVAFGNLLLSAFFERFLTDDATATSLSLYLLLQFTGTLFLVSSVYFDHIHDIVHRCRIYPLDAGQRIRSVIRAMAGNRTLLALGGSALFSLAVLYHSPWLALIITAGLFAAGFSAVVCGWSILLLGMTRHHLAPAAVFVPLGLMIFAVAALVATSTLVDLLVASPVAGWIALGILGATRGESAPAAAAASGCCLLIVLAVWQGRRYA